MPYRVANYYEKELKIDIHAIRFALITVFSFKNKILKQYDSRFIQKRLIFDSGTVHKAFEFFFD
jgi:hypothetical protein